MTMDERDADRLELLDRLAERIPELDLSKYEVDWIEMPDGAQGLAVAGDPMVLASGRTSEEGGG